MAHTLLHQDFVHGNENAGFLHVAELTVDGGAEHAHRGAQAHVGIDQRGNVVAQLTHLAVQNLIVFLEGVLAEEGGQFAFVSLDPQRFDGGDEAFLVAEVLLQEIEDHWDTW